VGAIEALGGAVSSPPLGLPSSVPFRGARYNVTGMAIWTNSTADDQQRMWAREISSRLTDVIHNHDGYVNYASDLCSSVNDTGRTDGVSTSPALASTRERVDPARILIPPVQVRYPRHTTTCP